MTPLARLLVLLIRGYQVALSPMLGRRCRFAPTCSEYARRAVVEHGAVRGSALALARLGRCHPFHRGGYDPPPPATTRQV